MNTPYLSIVAASRNDDHGGDLLHRTQVFVSGVQEQMARFKLNAELLIVEWNPPRDRKPLAEVLHFDHKNTFCPVRFVTVPVEVHEGMNSSSSLPFYQMIAKNVGVRRAKGQFVLCTNIDILFSNPLMEFLASRSMKTGVYYRCNRVDVKSEIPAVGIAEQLTYCEQNRIRLNEKRGTFVVSNKPTNENSRPQVSWFRKIFRLPRWLFDRYDEMKMYGEDVLLHRRWAVFMEFVARFLPIPPLHTNGCGDFTLMSRADWLRVGGYLELPIYSMHIDSLLLHQAISMGMKEETLTEDRVIYHIEHGGGWTPEKSVALFRSLKRRGIEYLTYGKFRMMAWKLHHKFGLRKFREDWGFAGHVFQETVMKNEELSC